MKLSKCFKLAFNILRHSKLRSWLSVIGIVIGVASVIIIMALGEGMQRSVEQRLGSFGADIITVSAGFSRAAGSQARFMEAHDTFHGVERNNIGTTVKNLTNKEVQALKSISNIAYIQGTVSGRADIGYLDETTTANVKGVDTAVWKNIETTKLESGRYLVAGDKNVVVLSNRIAKKEFKTEIQLNKPITIEGKQFRVVGILKESSGMGSSGSIVIPIEAARTTLEDIGEKEFNSIEIKVKDVNIIDNTLDEINTRLMLVRAVNEKTKDFSVNSIKAIQETIEETLSIMTLFLTAIAAISLLVGAVGIANTMFTTVLEKTKDIGIMKSIGAKNRDILLIFLFNSGMVGLAGGIIGGIIGVLGSLLISSLLSGVIPAEGGVSYNSIAVVTPKIILLVLGISILIGILSGVIPAYNASKKNPVDALRYE